VHVLRALIMERYGHVEGDLSVTLLSFGFKHGIPVEADMVLDVRFLPNPFFVPQLSALSGEDEAVARFVLDDPETKPFVARRRALIAVSVEGFQREGKSYATVAIGCTGGRHRSSPSPRSWASGSASGSRSRIRHRDIQRGGARNRVNWPGCRPCAREGRCGSDGGGTPVVGLVLVTHGGSGACLLSRPPRSSGRSRPRPRWGVVGEEFGEVRAARRARCDGVESGAGLLILVDVHGSSEFQACSRCSTGRGPSRSCAA